MKQPRENAGVLLKVYFSKAFDERTAVVRLVTDLPRKREKKVDYYLT